MSSKETLDGDTNVNADVDVDEVPLAAPSLFANPSLGDPRMSAAAIALEEDEELDRKREAREEKDRIRDGVLIEQLTAATTTTTTTSATTNGMTTRSLRGPSQSTPIDTTHPSETHESFADFDMGLLVSDDILDAATLVSREADASQQEQVEEYCLHTTTTSISCKTTGDDDDLGMMEKKMIVAQGNKERRNSMNDAPLPKSGELERTDTALSVARFLPPHAIVRPGAIRVNSGSRTGQHIVPGQANDASLELYPPETGTRRDSANGFVAARIVTEEEVDADARTRILAGCVMAESVQAVGEDGMDGSIDNEAVAKEQTRRRRGMVFGILLLVLIAAVAMSVVVGRVLPSRGGGPLILTATPSFVPSQVRSVSPTISFPTIAPSFTPTSKPSVEPSRLSLTFLIDLLQERLPSLSFENVTSPESQALEWMIADLAGNEALSNDGLVQRFVMANLGFAISGLSDWLTAESECLWGNGEMVCNSVGVMEVITLSSQSLYGTIPLSIGLLSNLVELTVPGNDITGTIPSEVGKLVQLTQLHISSNGLFGTLPTEVGSMTALETLALEGNKLTGSVPSEVGLLTNLNELDLNSNRHVGSLPLELTNLVGLARLLLQFNAFTGTIPSKIGSMSNLVILALTSNEISGTIPTEIGSLTDLDVFTVDFNMVSGTIPSEIGRLEEAAWIFLDHNILTGTIPVEFGLLSRLDDLWLDNNNLFGTIPPVLCSFGVVISIDCGKIECSCCTFQSKAPC